MHGVLNNWFRTERFGETFVVHSSCSKGSMNASIAYGFQHDHWHKSVSSRMEVCIAGVGNIAIVIKPAWSSILVFAGCFCYSKKRVEPSEDFPIHL